LPGFTNAGNSDCNLTSIIAKMIFRFTLLLFLICAFKSGAQEGYLPYGTMRVNDRFIADQTEILVQEWLGYIISACDSNSTRFLRVERKLTDDDKIYLRKFRYPDSLLPLKSILVTLEWSGLLDTSGGFRTFKTHGANSHQTLPIPVSFFTSKAKRKELNHLLNLPVTGISYQQAMAFCQWRTYVDSVRSDTMFFFHYTFSLPTIAQFNLMNLQTDSVIRKTRTHAITIGYDIGPTGFNYKNVTMELLTSTARQNDLQDPWEFDSNYLGLYAVQGNVAEMTGREGAACGGSYFHYAIESYRYQIQVYERPERWLGFRCIATIQ
jgi:hypothetical protein